MRIAVVILLSALACESEAPPSPPAAVPTIAKTSQAKPAPKPNPEITKEVPQPVFKAPARDSAAETKLYTGLRKDYCYNDGKECASNVKAMQRIEIFVDEEDKTRTAYIYTDFYDKDENKDLAESLAMLACQYDTTLHSVFVKASEGGSLARWRCGGN